MSKAHLELLQSRILAAKWKFLSESDLDIPTDHWIICKPNGEKQLQINFIIGGNGKFGAHIGNETISNALGCSIDNYPHISIYFGKYARQFQIDINQFVRQLSLIDKK
jgi:hypothetical protein